MRYWMLVAAFAAAAAVVSPASADTIITSTSTCTSTTACSPDTSSLSAFDPTLGTLTGISLQVNGSKTDAIMGIATNPPQTGSAQLSYSGRMSVLVNGATYTFDITGAEQDIIISGFNGIIGGNGLFTASGSGTFLIDPSVFGTFIAPANCGALIGLCVTGAPNGGSDYLTGIFHNVVNANVSVTDAAIRANFSLTYTYSPFNAVPEPASWAMMLVGFGAIGFQARRNKFATPSTAS